MFKDKDQQKRERGESIVQEEVENKTLALTINTTKFSGHVLKSAIRAYLSRVQAKGLPSYGRVSMRKLQQQHGDLKSVNIDDTSTRQFERIARKYRVQYKVFRLEKGKYQIFFRSPNEEAMQAAFQEYAARRIKQAQRPSVLQRLEQLKAKVRQPKRAREKRKEQVR